MSWTRFLGLPGPARLMAEFNATADGAVHALWRFDTVKGRYTLDETAALIKALDYRLQLLEGE